MGTKKIKIRIALVVDSNGDYSGCGWSPTKESLDGFFDICFDGLEGKGTVEHKYVIETEVDIPELPIIECTATKQPED